MIGATRCEFAVIFVQVTLRFHRVHGFGFHFHHRRDVHEYVGLEVTQLGLVRFEEIKFGRGDPLECAGNACTCRQEARLLYHLRGNRVVRVERVKRAVCKHNVWFYLLKNTHQLIDPCLCHF